MMFQVAKLLWDYKVKNNNPWLEMKMKFYNEPEEIQELILNY